MPEILVLAAARAAVVVRSNATAMRPTIPTFHPFFRTACDWPRDGVFFCGDWDRLTCLRHQLIFEGVDFIAENAVFFLHRGYCVGEGGVVGNDVDHVVGEE